MSAIDELNEATANIIESYMILTEFLKELQTLDNPKIKELFEKYRVEVK